MGIAIILLQLIACLGIWKGLHGNRLYWLASYGLTILSWFAQLYFLHAHIDTVQGQDLSVLNLLSLTAVIWLGVVLAFRSFLAGLLLVVLPLNMLTIAAISLSVPAAPLQLLPLGQQPVALWHVLIAWLAYALLGVAFLQACALRLQLKWLGSAPQTAALSWLPPIEAMQGLMIRMVWAALILLTAGIFLGGWQSWGSSAGNAWQWKSIGSLLAWFLTAGLLAVQYTSGLKLKYAILGTGLAWMCLTSAYFGVKIIHLLFPSGAL